MTINPSLILLENADTAETICAFFRFSVSSLLTALQDTGSHAISRQNNLELHLSCHTCWLSYLTLVYLWCGRTVGRTVTWWPNFLGWVDYYIFLPMAFRFARESSAINNNFSSERAPRAYMGDEGSFQACLSPHFTSLPQPADSCIQKLQCEQNLRCRYKIL